MGKNTQKEPWFLEINPNGRIPALTDTFTDGQQIRLFESGSIMQYLVEQYDTKHVISYPKGSREHYEVNNWLFFLNAGVGPMQVRLPDIYAIPAYVKNEGSQNSLTGPSKPFLPLCTRKDPIRHQPLPERNPAPLRHSGQASRIFYLWLYCRQQMHDRRHCTLGLGACGALGGHRNRRIS